VLHLGPNHSRGLIERSRECVVNVPTFDLIDAVIGVENTHGPETDKFAEFGLTPAKANEVGAPLIEECYANFECRLIDDSQSDKYSLFVFECVKAPSRRRRSTRRRSTPAAPGCS
jgi:flavin reductase (DIM6/NTAB) family NADH-FMN oxidoreductase RutF